MAKLNPLLMSVILISIVLEVATLTGKAKTSTLLPIKALTGAFFQYEFIQLSRGSGHG